MSDAGVLKGKAPYGCKAPRASHQDEISGQSFHKHRRQSMLIFKRLPLVNDAVEIFRGQYMDILMLACGQLSRSVIIVAIIIAVNL